MREKELSVIMNFGSMLQEVFRAFKNLINSQSNTPLTINQFGFLIAIYEKKEEVIQKDMAEVLGKDQSSILRIVDSLEKKELIRRVVDNDDRRKNFLMVTKKGDHVIEQYLKIESQLDNKLLDGLSKSDIDTFYKVTDHIKNNASKI